MDRRGEEARNGSSFSDSASLKSSSRELLDCHKLRNTFEDNDEPSFSKSHIPLTDSSLQVTMGDITGRDVRSISCASSCASQRNWIDACKAQRHGSFPGDIAKSPGSSFEALGCRNTVPLILSAAEDLIYAQSTDGSNTSATSHTNMPHEHFSGELAVSGESSPRYASEYPNRIAAAKIRGNPITHMDFSNLGSNERTGPQVDAHVVGFDGRSALGSTAVDILGRSNPVVRPRYFVSRRVRKEDIQRPWLEKRDPREKWLTIIPCIGIVTGLCIAAFLIWDGMRTVINHSYCLVLDDDFSNGLDPSIWAKEAELGGFGNGQFEMTTIDEENVYVDDSDNSLTFLPMLQDGALIDHNTVINLTHLGICSSDVWSDCVATTNTTNGTIVNPVKSARISTQNGPHIKYGRVEVTATLPAGDWLWPAIWMMPVNATYGLWPQSGEIDIMESRGNNYTYPLGGNNIMSSTLHWGPSPSSDAWWKSTSDRMALHSTYSQRPHIFGMEWSETYIFTYVDNRLLQVLYFDFLGDLWARGQFPLTDPNGTRFVDPWSQTGRPSTPFDENFYLIINLAVGATNGWFEDGAGGKPWVDASKTARRDFWDAQSEWYPTWTGGSRFKIHRVQMWQQQGYNGCMED